MDDLSSVEGADLDHATRSPAVSLSRGDIGAVDGKSETFESLLSGWLCNLVGAWEGARVGRMLGATD
jgi:hypothetical protein